MKRERSKMTVMQSGVDAGLDIPISQVSLPTSEDLVSQLFEKEEFSRMQIKDMTANGGKSYLEIQHILATRPFLNDEDRKAFQETFTKTEIQPSKLSGHKSPFEAVIDKFIGLIASLFGLEGDKKSDNWLKANLFK